MLLNFVNDGGGGGDYPECVLSAGILWCSENKRIVIELIGGNWKHEEEAAEEEAAEEEAADFGPCEPTIVGEAPPEEDVIVVHSRVCFRILFDNGAT